MASAKGQRLLTDYFRAKKTTLLARNHGKTKCQRELCGSGNVTPKKTKCPLDLGAILSKKTKFKRIRSSCVSRKLSDSFKDEILSKMAALPPVEPLVEMESCWKLPAIDNIYHSSTEDLLPLLALPYEYKVLNALFCSVDLAVAMLYNRSEMCTFSKIQAVVQEKTKRKFDLRRLAQIVAVYPEAYNLIQEKTNALPHENGEKQSYYLLITPSIPQNENNQVSATLLTNRNNLFEARLLNRVKDHHQVFLQNLNPPITVDREQLVRWHSKFNPENIPDVVPAKLPTAT